MTLRAYRLVPMKYAATAFDGEGAWREGARWNSQGVRVVYAAESLSLAQLECLVHVRKVNLLRNYVVVQAEFAAELCLDVERRYGLPPDWRAEPPSPSTQSLGTRWVREAASAVLRVPSAVTSGESNLVFNPRHPGFAEVKLHPATEFRFDLRLLG